MKKLLLLALGAAGAALAFKKAKANQHEATLWSEATDNVKRS